MSRRCAECGAAIARQTVAEAVRPWRHVDVEDRRVSTCPGASLLAHAALVRVDNDAASDAPWSTFLEVNLAAGLDLESIGDIEVELLTCGQYIGHHDADVALVAHLDEIASEGACFDAPSIVFHPIADGERALALSLLDIANRARHSGEDTLADFAIARMSAVS